MTGSPLSTAAGRPPARLPLGGDLLPAAPAAPRLLAAFGAAVDWAVVAIGAVMIVLVFVNVLLHIVGRDLAAVTELAELLMVWVTFLSGASAARRGAQMTITEFIDKLGGKGRERADAAIDVLAIGMLLLLFWYGINLVIVGWGNELTVLQIPMSFQYLGMPVGVAAILVWTVYDLWQIGQGKTRAQRWAKE
ncbi:MAG: TRAP transporter small permease [Betaproteobacteria bacterium]|nr:TRAP transporter small permease [Betaproteobacteria bacterium]